MTPNPTPEQRWVMRVVDAEIEQTGDLRLSFIEWLMEHPSYEKAVEDTPEHDAQEVKDAFAALRNNERARNQFIEARKQKIAHKKLVDQLFAELSDEAKKVLDSDKEVRDNPEHRSHIEATEKLREASMAESKETNSKDIIDNVEIEYASSKEQKKIVIPDGMPLKEVAEWVQRRMVEDERKVAVHEIVDAYPLDGALALRVDFAQAEEGLFW